MHFIQHHTSQLLGLQLARLQCRSNHLARRHHHLRATVLFICSCTLALLALLALALSLSLSLALSRNVWRSVARCQSSSTYNSSNTGATMQPPDVWMWRAKVSNGELVQGMLLEILRLLGDQSPAIYHEYTHIAGRFEPIQQHAPKRTVFH